jgi:ComF family protein
VRPLEHGPPGAGTLSALGGGTVKAWAVAALDLIYPAWCPVCGARLGTGRRDPLCGPCWRAIVRLEPPWCARCGRPAPGPAGASPVCGPCRETPPAWDWARAAGLYAGPLREALHAFKFGGRRALAGPLAELVLEQCGPDLPATVDALVPVPLARRRESERGFNQAGLIAERLARRLGRPVRPRWLRRVRPTTPQTDLGAEARRANVRDAFVASPRVAGRALVLIDDVYTTGATAGECARTLKAAGARAVGVLTVARVP